MDNGTIALILSSIVLAAHVVLLALILFLLPLVIVWASSAIIYSRCGRQWWEAIIPIYSWYVFAKIAGKPWWWILLFFFPLTSLIFIFLASIEVAKRFELEWPFAVGMTLLPVVFYPILAYRAYHYPTVE